MFDRDRVINADRSELSRAAFSVLNALQDQRRETMIAGLGLLLEVLSERFNLSPADIMTAVGNILKTTGDPRADQHITALREFVKNEF